MANLDCTPTKRCSKCKWFYPKTSEYFGPNSRAKDGFNYWCRNCHRASAKKWRSNNPDYNRLYLRKWQKANKDKVKGYDAKYYEANSDKVIKRVKQWNSAHPERTRINNRNRKNSRTSRRIAEQNRQARKRDFPAEYTSEDWNRALEYFGYCCAVCERPVGLWHTIAQDHWIPLSSPDCPGTVPENIVPLCHSLKDGWDGCNNSKHSSMPVEWLTAKFGKRKARKITAKIQTYFDSLRGRKS